MDRDGTGQSGTIEIMTFAAAESLLKAPARLLLATAAAVGLLFAASGVESATPVPVNRLGFSGGRVPP